MSRKKFILIFIYSLFSAANLFADDSTISKKLDATNVSANSASDNKAIAAPNGIYPIWENNGYVRNHRQIVVGYLDAQIGIKNVLHLGTQPSAYIFRTPNFQAKVQLFKRGKFQLAGQVGFYAMLPGASESFFSGNYSARIHNPNFAVFAIPITIATTWEVTKFLNLHHSLTGMTVFGPSPVRTKGTIGNFLTAEVMGFKYHSLGFHAGETGMWDHDLWILGGSYRFNYRWFEARVGYFYRKGPEGWQGQPLVNASVIF